MNFMSGIGNGLQGLSLPTSVSTLTNGNVQGSTAKASVEAAGADSLQISQGSVQSATTLSSMAGVLAQSLSGPDERAGKVEALQAAIAVGTYNVSAADVADKLIQSLLK
jgi:flagellar biosynthesis anti-sigma factor FlgM